MNARVALIIAVSLLTFIIGTVIAVIRDIKYIDASIRGKR